MEPTLNKRTDQDGGPIDTTDYLGWEQFSPEDPEPTQEPIQEPAPDSLASNPEQDREHLAESYLDYHRNIKVDFDQTEEGDLTYDFECEAPNEHLRESVIESLRRISSLEPTDDPDVMRLSLNDTIFVDVNRLTGEVESVNKLTAFETRLLAQGHENDIPFSREKLTDFRPATDLHTHLAGALRPETIIEVSRAHETPYPISMLSEMGINASVYESEDGQNVKMSDLNQEDLDIFYEHMILPLSTQETFTKMEEIYTLRGPLTKNKELMPDYLNALADDYQASGVKYAELSFSSFLNPGQDGAEWMQILEDNLPDIEARTGVKLRFVAGLWRHSDKEWSLDNVDQLISAVSRSPYIVGCDFMGHETNKTTDFEEELRMLARYCMTSDPDFTIRVHAGENPIFDSNVRDTLQIIYDEHRRAEQADGVEYPMPNLRLGHGLYGVDDETLGLAKEVGAIVEFNMSSNLALNNVDGIGDIPIKRYLDHDVDVVLGTDGHGLYSTFGEQEIILASAAGLTERDFTKMRATEAKILAAKERREANHPRIADTSALYGTMRYSTPDGQPRWNDEVARKYREEAAAAEAQLNAKMNSLGIITDPAEIEAATAGKVPILITGASRGNWKSISDEDQDHIRVVTQTLANLLNPDTAYLVTGGTNFGAEKTVHEAVHRRNAAARNARNTESTSSVNADGTIRTTNAINNLGTELSNGNFGNNPNESNSENSDQLVCWGTLTMDATHDGAAGVMPNTVTHISILKDKNGRNVSGWKSLPDTQIGLLGETGEMIAFGGGDIVKNMIQRAHNLGVSLHLMKGPEGASTSKSHALVGHNYSFETTQELIISLYERNPNLFRPDFNPEDLNRYIATAVEEIARNPYTMKERTHGQPR